jgi:hypothetical protein
MLLQFILDIVQNSVEGRLLYILIFSITYNKTLSIRIYSLAKAQTPKSTNKGRSWLKNNNHAMPADVR